MPDDTLSQEPEGDRKKHPGGRPTAYDPSFCDEARELAEEGLTDQEIADHFGVDRATLYKWKNKHKPFRDAIRDGGSRCDDRVERSLYQKAVGYEIDAVKVFMPAGAKEPVYAPYKEWHAPDTAAAFIWLKNRRSGKWRDRHEHTGADGAPLIPAEQPGELARRMAFALLRASATAIEPVEGQVALENGPESASEPTG